MASVLLVCLASYLLGSIPNGLVFGKLLWHVDLREYGSHNIGATNAWRTLGKGPGFLIFLLDFLKGALSVGLAEVFTASPLIMVIAGILAIVGHSCSLFLHFKGGKGVATGLGEVRLARLVHRGGTRARPRVRLGLPHAVHRLRRTRSGFHHHPPQVQHCPPHERYREQDTRRPPRLSDKVSCVRIRFYYECLQPADAGCFFTLFGYRAVRKLTFCEIHP